MAISKYTLYKYVKVGADWRYRKAAYHDNGKIKPDIVFVNVKHALVEKHTEGRYYMNHNGRWIDAGADALKGQQKRKQRLALDEYKRLSEKGSAESAVVLPEDSGRITLAVAAERYFANCEARGLAPESIRKYRAAVDPFVEHCGVTYIDECRDKQVLFNYMGWLRKRPVPKRKHGNPERTLANKIEDVRIFLKEFGITKLLKKNEEPKYHKKIVVAHPDDELDLLYGAANAEETFLLDFFLGSMARDHEAYGKDRQITSTVSSPASVPATSFQCSASTAAASGCAPLGGVFSTSMFCAGRTSSRNSFSARARAGSGETSFAAASSER